VQQTGARIAREQWPGASGRRPYEGWNPSKSPTGERNVQSFLNRVADNLMQNVDGDPETVTRAVFKVLQDHVTAGEIQDVKSNLPTDVQALWP
jgi:uncharacterized protein (DUF2267 family)